MSRNNTVCHACFRAVHDHMRTIAISNGRKETFCCPACALTEHQQSGHKVEVLSLTDHDSGKAIVPAQSYIVRGSDVNMCQHHEPTLGQDRQPLATQFDRCSPSIIAFSDMEAAKRFRAAHGGEFLRFAEIAARYR